ncbi:MAG: COX15/CtaA family protein [Flavobacteriaceae bacterium]|jgi:cytochrome c oxidase assembly protein subunit 15|tara:strand:- start:4240 stop:4650 length:411 start_codon:yes stop_codon:yes gene_type:complete
MLNIKLLKRLVIISMFIMLIQILLGLKVREFIDLKIDLYGFENKNMWLSNPEINFFIHRSFSIFIFISNAFLFYLARKIKTNLTWIKFILILIIIEIIAGASMYYFAFPILSQPIHLLIAIIIFGLQFYWYLILDD